ncbi:hypothetical protein JXA31_09315 [Candidatus Bathyarchaeota archaeon]|nr:hypothetical protein [Candidatus Bathyarchaeota archaeon]
MKTKCLVVFLISLLTFQVFLNFSFPVYAQTETQPPDVFFGVDVAYENLTEIKVLIDEISSYTNLLGIGCTGITYNVTRLDEVCQYVYDKGLSFLVYTERFLNRQWLEDAKNRWGERFLGFYVWDEIGGKQLDLYEYKAVDKADNYTDASNQFFDIMAHSLNFVGYNDPAVPAVFTSDYALYWFDYKIGYDVVLAQLGWNYSRQLNIALCRGAATMHEKEWGVIVAWTYTEPPYIESGEELYKDLVLAYENGAKYILIFDSNKNYTQGILEKEHLTALKQFWQYMQNNPRENSSISDRVAYVLPNHYGYGFRGPSDKIWGLWEADNLTDQICKAVGNLLEEYGPKLDIIYDEELEPDNTYGYSKLFFWNASLSPFSTPQPNPFLDLPTELVYTLSAVTSVAVVGTCLIVYFWKRKKTKLRKTPLNYLS